MSSRVLGIVVTRRAVATAALEGHHLDDAAAIALSGRDTDYTRAAEFVRVALLRHRADGAALLGAVVRDNSRRSHARAAVEGAVRALGVPLWEVPAQELFPIFSVPAARSLNEVNRVVAGVWPTLDDPDASDLQGATAVALFVEVHRFLSVLEED